MSLVGSRVRSTASDGTIDGEPIQFVREGKLGAPALPEHPEAATAAVTIVNVDDVEGIRRTQTRVDRTRRLVSRAAGSVDTGLQHVVVEPGRESTAQHCHSLEEEIFVILDGDGVLVLDDEETPVGPGPRDLAAAGHRRRAHVPRRRPGLTYLAYGTRDPGDVCYYPRSNKIAFRGVGVIARLEQLDYWDGED